MGETIVITGMGIHIKGGENVTDFARTLIHNKKVLEPVDGIAPKGRTMLAGYLGDISNKLSPEAQRSPRISQLAILAVGEALKDCGYSGDHTYTGVFAGTSMGGVIHFENVVKNVLADEFGKMSVLDTGMIAPYSPATDVAGYFGVNGIVRMVSSACTSGIDAIADAIVYLQSGQIDRAIVVGSDASIGKLPAYCFSKVRATSRKGMEYEGIPFSNTDSSFAFAEGAAALILERKSDVTRLGTSIYAEISGVGTTNDGLMCHKSEASGEMLKYAIELAVKRQSPDFVMSQALGMSENDDIEARNHMALFGNNIPITSIKGHVGHTFGASGLVSAIAAIWGMKYDFIPATLTDQTGYEYLPIVRETMYESVNSALITAHGYGGSNAALFLKK